MNGDTVFDNNTGQWYYNWYAATAGTGTSSQINTDTEKSICPKGWRLPPNNTISTTKSYYNLLSNAYGISTGGNVSTMESVPLSYTRSGYRDPGSTLIGSGSYGNYWSSTAYPDATFGYAFFYDSSRSLFQTDGRKFRGFNIRCVAL